MAIIRIIDVNTKEVNANETIQDAQGDVSTPIVSAAANTGSYTSNVEDVALEVNISDLGPLSDDRTFDANPWRLFLATIHIDDNYISVWIQRNYNDLLGLIENLSKDVSKEFSENTNITELLTLQSSFIRTFNEATTISEILQLVSNYQRTLSENTSLIEAIQKDLSKYITDTTIVNDSDILLQISHCIDMFTSVTAIETLVKNISKAIDESTTIIETLVKDFSRSLPNDSTSIVEYIINELGKNISDTTNITETVVKGYGRNSSESTAIVLSGVLLNQGYVDNATYFAEDFVGDSRTL